MANSIRLVINGLEQNVTATNVLGLLAELGLGDKKIAIERNKHIVPREKYSTTALEEGDQLEVVTFVGGG